MYEGESLFLRKPQTSPDSQSAAGTHVCANCGTTSTPLWRRNQEGKHICNACGLYEKTRNSQRPVGMRIGNRSRAPRGQGPAECSNCGTTNTSTWRRGEGGERICNACGLYFKLHKVQRPKSMRVSVVHNRRRFQDEHLDFNFSVNPAKSKHPLLPPPFMKLQFDAIPSSVVLHRPVARRADAALHLPGLEEDSLPPLSPTKLTVNFMLSPDPSHHTASEPLPERSSLELLSNERRCQLISNVNQLLCHTGLALQHREAMDSEDLKHAVKG